MKIVLPWLLLLTILSHGALAQEQSPTEATPTFREPFTLKLRVHKQHYYEQYFDKVPYVAGSDVYLFVNDHFGVSLSDTKANP